MANRVIVAQTQYRMTAEEYGRLQAVAEPFEDMTSTLRRCVELCLSPADTVIRYRIPQGDTGGHKGTSRHKLFPEWRTWGPIPAAAALDRAVFMQGKGFEVETIQVSPRAPAPAWPDDDSESGDSGEE